MNGVANPGELRRVADRRRKGIPNRILGRDYNPFSLSSDFQQAASKDRRFSRGPQTRY